MSVAAWIIAIAWVVTGSIKLYAINRMEYNISRERQQMLDERATWMQERRELLDRIQAPSFGEMKQAEVKKIRAENGEKPPAQIIPM